MEEPYTSSSGPVRAGYLAAYYDPGLELPRGLTVATIVADECERISSALAIVLFASTIPRRLGGDASSDELAEDKKRCRRVAHALRQAYRGWDMRSPSLNDSEDVRQAGAQLVWSDFGTRHLTRLNSRLVLSATFAIRAGEDRWGKSAVTNYRNERNWVEYALR